MKRCVRIARIVAIADIERGVAVRVDAIRVRYIGAGWDRTRRTTIDRGRADILFSARASATAIARWRSAGVTGTCIDEGLVLAHSEFRGWLVETLNFQDCSIGIGAQRYGGSWCYEDSEKR